MVQSTCGEDTERRKKERSPPFALPGLRSVVSVLLLTLQSKVACLMRSLELVSSVLSSSSISWYTFKKLAAHNSSAWLA